MILDMRNVSTEPIQNDNTKEMLSTLKSTYLSDRNNVKALLESYGYSINKLFQFAHDKSLVISDNCYIKQFGSIKDGFDGGDCIDYLIATQNKSFKDVVNEVYSFFNGNNLLSVKAIQKQSKQKPKKDLTNIYNQMKKNPIPKGLVSELINPTFLSQCENIQEVLKDVIVYDKYNKCLAIVIKG
ncbi:hypothetical protein ALC152_01400 [Arcobacter sp. 15-2]|uniref:hypothetical protein n=1 Tax=Arcobacter sp. 15-2 TaxID=3374109 RepID=UPI00399CAAFF